MRLLGISLVTAALLMTPVAAQAKRTDDDRPRDRAAKRQKAHKNRGVVRSFSDGVLTIDRARGRDRSGLVTEGTKLACVDRAAKPRRKSRHKRARHRGRHRGRGRRRGRERAGRRVRKSQATPPDDVLDEDDSGGDGDEEEDDGILDDILGDDESDDDEADEVDDGEDEALDTGCSVARLVPGARVLSAKARRTPDGIVFTKITLVR